MFETMIHSTEELNAMAVHLRLSENFSELKLLASEWLVEKLRAEMWLIKDQMFTDIVSKYLIRKAEDNPVFGMQVLQKHKTIQKCMNYIREQAYEIAKKEHEKKTSGKQPATGRNQNVALGISELQVYQWAEDYYALDDAKKEAEERAKEQKKRVSKQKKSIQRKTQSSSSEKPISAVPTKNTVPPKKKQPENIQLSLFDMTNSDS